MRPRKAFARFAGTAATLTLAALFATPLQAYALTTGSPSWVSPPCTAGSSPVVCPVQTTEQTLSGFYEGDAGVVTITFPSGTFADTVALRAEQCNNNPTTSAACDGATLATTSADGSTQLESNATGGATVTFLLYELPTGNTPDANGNAGIDPGSNVTCSDTKACSIWVGTDPSAGWANGYALDGMLPIAAPSQGQVPESPSVPLLALSGIAVAGAGYYLFFARRRRAHNC
ncbi:MAG TPA: hypothetical protein VMS00_00655 [Acidimicrobiales bacterium]|nr:hypothetical protein [Acidimicrobiales bacterium]